MLITSLTVFLDASNAYLKDLKGLGSISHFIILLLEGGFVNIVRPVSHIILRPRSNAAHLKIESDKVGTGDVFQDGQQLPPKVGLIDIHFWKSMKHLGVLGNPSGFV